MKVQMTEQELRKIFSCMQGHGRARLSEVALEVIAPPQPQADAPEDVSPEAQIRRDPTLALDTPEPPTLEQIQAQLLRWFKCPEQARGRSHFVPHGHPCGFGGQEIYIPRAAKYVFLQQRPVSVCLTVQCDGKTWDARHVPGVRVGQWLWLRVNDEGVAQALYTDAQGNEGVCDLTERDLG